MNQIVTDRALSTKEAKRLEKVFNGFLDLELAADIGGFDNTLCALAHGIPGSPRAESVESLDLSFFWPVLDKGVLLHARDMRERLQEQR